MLKHNAKLLLKSLDDKHFIYYQNSKAIMLIQVFPHLGESSAIDQHEYFQKYYAYHNHPYIGAITNLHRTYYLLATVRIFPGLGITEPLDVETMQPKLNRLADWYLHAYLIPVSKGETPNIPESNMIM